MTFLLKKLLMVPQPVESESMEDDGEEWFENDDVPELLRAKLQALKVCRYRCLAAHAKGGEKAVEVAAPVMKMYATLLEHNGQLGVQAGKEEEDVEECVFFFCFWIFFFGGKLRMDG